MTRAATRIAAVTAAGALAAGGATAGYLARGADSRGGASAAAASTALSAQPAASQSSLSVNGVYRVARNGVVEVLATQQSSGSPFPFGNDGGSQQAQAQGSGFVYDSDGHIVTNEHVVDGASSVSVRFSSGQTVRADVVGTDPSTDLAVLKVDNLPSGAKALTLGDSDALQVGDGVVAIGAPFGLAETVTTGIVSALDREIQAPNNYAIDGAIQTDAAINHGNSGGPLLDMNGRVIGVNAQIESDSGGNDGVGFAIPSSTVKSIATRLIAGGKVQHAYLGVSIEDASSGGASVSGVSSGTPAASAGVRSGDVITAVDGDRVTSASDLRSEINDRKPGDKVKLTLRRSGETETVTVTLGTRPAA